MLDVDQSSVVSAHSLVVSRHIRVRTWQIEALHLMTRLLSELLELSFSKGHWTRVITASYKNKIPCRGHGREHGNERKQRGCRQGLEEW